MTFTYPLTFPTELSINDVQVDLFSASTANQSPFSLQKQVYDLNAQRWELQGSLPPMNRDQVEVYNSFLFKLKGSVGTFLMDIPDSKNPRGTWGGTPLVDGGGQTGNTLNVSGFTPSVTDIAKAGDWFSVGTGLGTRLYKLVEDATSDVSGDAVLTFVPALRNSPSNASAITFQNAKGLFRLSNKTSGYKATPSSLYSITIQCEEAL